MKIYARSALICLAFLMFSFIFYHRESMIYKKMRNLKYHNSIYKMMVSTFNYGNEEFLINTPGCNIRNYAHYLQFPNTEKLNGFCGPRAVIIKPNGNNKIVFQIDKKNMQKYAKRISKVKCCFKFGSRVLETDNYVYTKCTPFKNGKIINLLQQVIRVICTEKINKEYTKTVYDDSYIMVKKIYKKKKHNFNKSWNILILGMSTMSRTRVYNTMPRTVQYLQRNKWLDYKGYHKVGNNNYINLMALLSNKNINTVHHNCARKSQKCDEIFIWQDFKKAGYITAYGDDYFNIPDEISKNGFEPPSTDHHVWPYFLTKYNRRKGNFFCTKNAPSGTQLLNYAYEFVESYKTNNFFGMFWINTFSSRIESTPTLIDKDIADFLQMVNKSHVHKNTFILLLSDHGITSGDIKTQIESYYEERMPMFFMWIPYEFQKLYAKEYNNALINQNRLISPYNLHSTMMNILKFSEYSKVTTSEICPQCTSLFEEMSPLRQCADAGIEDKSCTCHDLEKIDGDSRVNESTKLVVNYIQNKLAYIKTIPCMTCTHLHLKSVVRTHMYNHNNNMYYVIAIQMSPGNISYETTVLDDGKVLRILLPIFDTSPNRRGNCAIDPNDRMFCLCNITVCDKDSIISLYKNK